MNQAVGRKLRHRQVAHVLQVVGIIITQTLGVGTLCIRGAQIRITSSHFPGARQTFGVTIALEVKARLVSATPRGLGATDPSTGTVPWTMTNHYH